MHHVAGRGKRSASPSSHSSLSFWGRWKCWQGTQLPTKMAPAMNDCAKESPLSLPGKPASIQTDILLGIPRVPQDHPLPNVQGDGNADAGWETRSPGTVLASASASVCLLRLPWPRSTGCVAYTWRLRSPRCCQYQRLAKLFLSLSLAYRCCLLAVSSHGLSSVWMNPNFLVLLVQLAKVHLSDLILTSLPLSRSYLQIQGHILRSCGLGLEPEI